MRSVAVVVAAAAALLAGCSWVYDAQYDTRAGELEQSRQLFLPGAAQVQFMTASPSRLYWVDIKMPQNVQLLHSYDPASGAKIDYTFPSGNPIAATQYHFSDTFVVDCGSPMTAFDATQANAMIDTTPSGGSACAVDRSAVYFIGEDSNTFHPTLNRWTPRQGAPVALLDLAMTIVPNGNSQDIAGLGIDGNLVVLQTSLGALWTIDLGSANLTQTWLRNPAAEATGSVAFDDAGAAYVASGVGATTGGAMFTRYADLASAPIEKGIDDGGYDLNFQHADIQQLDADNNEFTLAQHHLVYRAKHGIFAYGFDTTKVVDLLLDRKHGDFAVKPLYRTPVVAGSTLFVQDFGDDGSGTVDRPVYSVDLTGRLR